jgi:hypothetical protein
MDESPLAHTSSASAVMVARPTRWPPGSESCSSETSWRWTTLSWRRRTSSSWSLASPQSGPCSLVRAGFLPADLDWYADEAIRILLRATPSLAVVRKAALVDRLSVHARSAGRIEPATKGLTASRGSRLAHMNSRCPRSPWLARRIASRTTRGRAGTIIVCRDSSLSMGPATGWWTSATCFPGRFPSVTASTGSPTGPGTASLSICGSSL